VGRTIVVLALIVLASVTVAAETVELRVAAKNPPAVAMYEKAGLRTLMYHMFKRL